MRALVKIIFVYFLASLPFTWQFYSGGRSVPDALLWGLRAPFDVIMLLAEGTPVALTYLGLFVFILFIGLTAVWVSESSRGGESG